MLANLNEWLNPGWRSAPSARAPWRLLLPTFGVGQGFRPAEECLRWGRGVGRGVSRRRFRGGPAPEGCLCQRGCEGLDRLRSLFPPCEGGEIKVVALASLSPPSCSGACVEAPGTA